MTEDELYMARAIALAKRAEEIDEVPVGALIVRDGEIIAEGSGTVIEGFEAFVRPYVEKGSSYQKEQVFVVNNRMADENDVLSDGDKVFVFAVIAGG